MNALTITTATRRHKSITWAALAATFSTSTSLAVSALTVIVMWAMIFTGHETDVAIPAAIAMPWIVATFAHLTAASPEQSRSEKGGAK